MDDSVGDQHFRKQHRASAELAMKEPAVPVRPIDHRCDGEDGSPQRLATCRALLLNGWMHHAPHIGEIGERRELSLRTA